jgi:chromosome segregation ATPase
MTRRERLEARIEKRAEWADKARARSDARFKTVRTMLDMMNGNPIKVGHHSERGHRRDIARVDANISKGVAEGKLAELHTSKAGNLEAALERTIFSDDANAIEALEAKIAELEAERTRMKAINAAYKKRDAGKLAELGLTLEALTAKLAAAGPYWGDRPHLPYELTNLGARIRDAKARIEEIRRRTARNERAEAAPDGVLIEGADYVAVTFAEKPERRILEALKAAGFHWSGGSWCGYRAKLPAELAPAEGETA